MLLNDINKLNFLIYKQRLSDCVKFREKQILLLQKFKLRRVYLPFLFACCQIPD